VKLNEPDTDETPLIKPADDIVKPAGREPAEIDHVYGAVPPIATSCCEYGENSIAFGKVVVPIVKAVTAITFNVSG
jgi:hypothetical protein